VILETDSTEEREQKLLRIQSNFMKLEQLKEEKSDEMVLLLDLFAGSLSLNEILNTDIPLLNHLKRSKIKLNNELRKGGA
jgi:hypothetical protein